MNFTDLFIGILHFAVFTLAGYGVLQATRTHQETLEFQARLFFWAIALRMAVALAIYEGGLVDTLKDEDGSGWMVGAAYRQAWEDQGHSVLDAPALFLQAYETSNRGYFFLLGALF